ncbi:MAG: hypothetical protein ACE15B_19440 [Bryobacteraceae bacterium]
MRRIAMLVCLLPLMLMAQADIFENRDFQKIYTAQREATLAGTAEVVTIQQPATTTGNHFFLDEAAVYCSVDCTFTVERSGTAATTTAFTPAPANPGIVAAKATAFHTSNVGASTVIGKYYVAAGGEKVVNLRAIRLRNGTRDNLTVRTSSITGTVRILVRWAEAQP